MTMVQPDTPLTDVLKLLLDAGVSALPVVDEKVPQGLGYRRFAVTRFPTCSKCCRRQRQHQRRRGSRTEVALLQRRKRYCMGTPVVWGQHG